MFVHVILVLLHYPTSHGAELDSRLFSDAIADITTDLGVARMQVSVYHMNDYELRQ